jgi:hypothetical protein
VTRISFSPAPLALLAPVESNINRKLNRRERRKRREEISPGDSDFFQSHSVASVSSC